MVAVYFQTWSVPWTTDPTQIFHLPIGVDMVILAFVTPQCQFTPGSFSGTGLQFSMDFSVVQKAIALVQAQGIKVLLGVGGSSYLFPDVWDQNIATNVASLCNALNCDGVDIDWEPSLGAAADTQFSPIIQGFRAALPKPKLITSCVWSTGAFDKDGSTYKGMNILGLETAGSDLDQLHLMAYDAGPPSEYDPIAAFKAYRGYYLGPILMGIEPGAQAWGGYVITSDEITALRDFVLSENSQNGFFIWSLQKDTTGSPTVSEIVALLNSGTVANASNASSVPTTSASSSNTASSVPVAAVGTQTSPQSSPVPVVVPVPNPRQFHCPHCGTLLNVYQ
jgi:glycosyl hydrolase family 18 (putative chitinase)